MPAARARRLPGQPKAVDGRSKDPADHGPGRARVRAGRRRASCQPLVLGPVEEPLQRADQDLVAVDGVDGEVPRDDRPGRHPVRDRLGAAAPFRTRVARELIVEATGRGRRRADHGKKSDEHRVDRSGRRRDEPVDRPRAGRVGLHAGDSHRCCRSAPGSSRRPIGGEQVLAIGDHAGVLVAVAATDEVPP